MYFNELGQPLLCGVFLKNKKYVHLGFKAAEATLSKLAVLASNNEVYFCYSLETLRVLSECAEALGIFKIQNNTSPGLLWKANQANAALILFINNKQFTIKLVQNFINLSIVDIYRMVGKTWFPLQKKATREEMLSFYKEDSRVFSFFLKQLDFHFSQISSTWYLQSSIAAVSFAYLKAYIKHADAVLYTSQHVFETLKGSFWGGRNELYASGVHENVTVLDFKSLYNKLLQQEFPVGNPTFIQNPKNLSAWGFYHVTVTSNLFLPILPQKKNSKVVYENGTFTGIFWSEELLLFKKHGGQILSISYGLIYSHSSAVFKEFAESCLKKRTSASPLEKILYKAIVNSVIGYLGFHSANSQHQIYRNIAIPMIIASRGRIAWYQQYTQLASFPEHVCIYADTDSFFIKNISQAFQFDPEIFNTERFRTVVFFEKKKYIALTQSGFYKHVGIASNLTLPAAIAYASAQCN